MNVVTKIAFAALASLALSSCGDDHEERDGHGHAHEQAQEEFERGPHNGRLLEEGDFAVELAIHERGVPPEFRVWLYSKDEPLPPTAASVTVELKRLDGQIDSYTFTPQEDYLRGNGVVEEPHSFDVIVKATPRDGEPIEWRYSSYEGRTRIDASTAAAMGVRTEAAGAQTLKEVIHLTGTVQADPSRISRVRARYPGVIREVLAEPSSRVRGGQVLAQVQSNESLQNYPLTAPIGGVVVEHRAQVGEATGDEPLFSIIDVSKVWIELDVFQSQLAHIEEGQAVALFDLDGKTIAAGRIARIAPLAMHGSQSVRARVVVENAISLLRPGQFITAHVTVAQYQVPLAVRKQALQRFRDFDVVFEQVGDQYEVRMLELGRSDENYVEVLSGLKSGASYVFENSYLIKADIEKSGASHDH